MGGARRYYDETGLSAVECDELIMKLHRAGYSQRQIAKRVGMSQPGVSRAIERIRNEGVGSGRVRS